MLVLYVVELAKLLKSLCIDKINICCAQETRWKGRSARLISGKGFKFKCFWIGDNDGFGGVAILIASKWIQNVISVNRINSRLSNNWILVDKSILTL